MLRSKELDETKSEAKRNSYDSSTIDENVPMIIPWTDDNFVRREVAICVTFWKVLYRKFVYFSTSEQFPLASDYMKWLYYWLNSSTKRAATREIFLLCGDISFLFPSAIYLLSFDFYLHLIVKSKEKWYVFYSLH